MFDIVFWELFFLFLLALFVLGPERLPVVASYLGKQFGKVQRYFSNVKSQIDDEVDSKDINKILKDQELSISELQKRIKEYKKDKFPRIKNILDNSEKYLDKKLADEVEKLYNFTWKEMTKFEAGILLLKANRENNYY